jgi:hypothetical protein
LNSQVHGLIVWVTLPDSGSRKTGIEFSCEGRANQRSAMLL